MAVEVPDRFPFLAVSGAGVLGEGDPIRNLSARRLLDGVTGAWADAGAAVAGWRGREALVSTVASGDPRELVFRVRVRGTRGRGTLLVLVDGQDVDVSVTLKKVSDGTTLDTDSGTIGGARTTISLSLSQGTADVWLEVAVREVGTPAYAQLWGWVAIEERGAASGVPSDWRVDTAAAAEGQPLDPALLQRLQRGMEDGWGERGRSGRWCWDVRSAPRLCGLRRVTRAFLWPMSRAASGVAVRVHGIVGEGTVRVGLILRRVTDLDRPPVEDFWAEVELDADAAAQTATLTVEPDAAGVSRLAGLAGDLVGVFVCVESEAGAETLVTASDTWGSGVVGSWDAMGRIQLEETPTAGLVDGIPQQQIRIPLVRYKNPAVPASGVDELADADLLEWMERGYETLEPTQLQRVDTTARFNAIIHPRPPSRYVLKTRGASADVWNAAYTASLSYLELQGLEVEETAFSALEGAGTRFNATQKAAAVWARGLYGGALGVWLERARVWMGPAAWGELDVSDAAAAWWGVVEAGPSAPSNPLTAQVRPTFHTAGAWGASWREAAVAVLKDRRTYETDDDTGYTLTAVRAAAWVRAVRASPGPLGVRQARFRLQARTTSTGTGTVDGDPVEVEVEVLDAPVCEPDLLHALQGVTPCGDWGRWGWRLVELELLDTNAAASSREIVLGVQMGDRTKDGLYREGGVIVEVGAFVVWEADGDPEEIGAA